MPHAPASSPERPDAQLATRERASVRKLAHADRPAVTRSLARAFYDDPVLSWFFPDDSRRAGQLEGLFGYFGEQVWFGHDVTYTTDQGIGAAVWVPPDEWHVGALAQIRMLRGVVSAIGVRDLPRALRGFNLMESEHPHDDHYYLPIVGVVPEWQGKGIGSALLAPILVRCDRERLFAYLEATSPRNRACYERNGFAVSGEIELPHGPPMWPMRREPRPAR